jgi:hypothetical protein
VGIQFWSWDRISVGQQTQFQCNSATCNYLDNKNYPIASRSPHGHYLEQPYRESPREKHRNSGNLRTSTKTRNRLAQNPHHAPAPKMAPPRTSGRSADASDNDEITKKAKIAIAALEKSPLDPSGFQQWHGHQGDYSDPALYGQRPWV